MSAVLQEEIKEMRKPKFNARRFRANLRKEAQAINERNRVPGDPHYKEPISPETRSLAEDTFARIERSNAAQDAHVREFGE